jgi:hypothetical protein
VITAQVTVAPQYTRIRDVGDMDTVSVTMVSVVTDTCDFTTDTCDRPYIGG